ncbi:MAG TPA: EAL domain-containing protein [Gammaproteobacteria bacterium]|nr:EAL domain-containing protein [Gammaproteobacteria bacterium]
MTPTDAQPTDAQPADAARRPARGRSLVNEVLLAEVVLAAVLGVFLLVGLAWTSGSVIRDNLGQWASRWGAELNELGAPFYHDEHDAVLGVERFIAKYPEIDRVTWYRADGGALLALDESGAVQGDAAALDDAERDELAAKAGAEPPYLLTESGGGQRYRLLGPIWTESFSDDGLFELDPGGARTSTELLGFVSVDLDFSTYESVFLPRLALASGLLLLLLGFSWAGGRLFLKRALAPLSDLQKPLAKLAQGDMNVEFPSPRHTELKAIVAALEDTIRALQKRESRLLHLANHDPLTGLHNRHRLIEALDVEIAECAAHKRRSALFFIDLDQFKYVNDTCGHAAGDELLKLAAQQIRHGVRTDDLVARFGGDEFVVLLKDISRNDAKIVASQVLELMRSLQHVEQEHVFHLQCSIGIASINGDRFSAHELIAQADIACQTAKSRGRNRLEVYSVAEKRSEQMAKDVDWMHRIRAALGNDGFVLYYQPLLHIKSGDVTHYEALLRLKTDDGVIGPLTFLPAAMRFGLMADIDRWVLGQAARALAEFGREDPRFSLSVNLSSFAFENEGLAGYVRALLKDHGVSGDRLTLEITEQLAVRFAVKTDRQLAGLRDLGCRIAIDDFGTGYSSFSYLKRLPVDYLKIDGSFIKGLPRDKVDQSMVRMVGEVARAAGMQTVAEYVHSAAALSLLAKYGIDYAQGFFIGRAAPRPQQVEIAAPRAAGQAK